MQAQFCVNKVLQNNLARRRQRRPGEKSGSDPTRPLRMKSRGATKSPARFARDADLSGRHATHPASSPLANGSLFRMLRQNSGQTG